uniref:AP complex subunit sigma n=1 Tax=Trichuris muris TaxID=70415 RepID=A0A5S6R2M6_TRIMR
MRLMALLKLYMRFMLLFSRQGKLRLQNWNFAYPEKVKKKILRDLVTTVVVRKPKMSAFVEYQDMKVCELDIIFNFEKAYFTLDEFMLGVEVQEMSKKQVLKAIAAGDLMQDETPQGSFEDHGLR